MPGGWARGGAWIAAVMLAAAATTDTQGPAAPTLCAGELDAQRRAWDAMSPAIVQPSIAAGDRLRHWPTAALGVWLVEHTTGSGSTLTRVGPESLVRVRWSAACAPTRDERPRVPATEPAFTDASLTELLQRRSRGVLFLWSPHLPLSVDGYAEITAAARGRGLVVEPLLDPTSDRGFASTSVRDRRLPEVALRVADSLELQFRELPLHAPAVLVFSEGRLIGPVLRGFRSADEYGAFFDRVLTRP